MDLDLTLAITLILTLTLACLLLSLRSSSSKLAQLTLEQILEHLDNLRLSLSNTKNNCETNAHTHTIHTSSLTISNGDDVCLSVCLSVFTQTPILQALQHVQASCDEAHKMRYTHTRGCCTPSLCPSCSCDFMSLQVQRPLLIGRGV